MSALAEVGPQAPYLTPERPHLLGVVNPGSQNYLAALAQVELYIEQRLMTRDDIVVTSPIRAETAEKVSDKVWKPRADYDAVVVLTGDGGVNASASALIGTLIPVYSGGFGTINDGHIITVGKQEKGLVASQPVVPIFPYELTITHPDKEVSNELALFYASLGYTALGAERINGPAHRNSPMLRYRPTRKVREAMTVGKAWLQNEPFEIQKISRIQGREREMASRSVHEYLLSNSPRMAGMSLFPGNPETRSITKLEIASHLGILARLGQQAVKTVLGKNSGPKPEKPIMLFEKAWQEVKRVSFKIATESEDRTVPMQFDGETIRLAHGTRLDIKPAREPLYVIAPHLANK